MINRRRARERDRKKEQRRGLGEPASSLLRLGVMTSPGQQANCRIPASAAVFGSNGAIGRAFCEKLAEMGCEKIFAGSRRGETPAETPFVPFAYDLEDEPSIVSAAQLMADHPPEWIIVASGILSLGDGTAPERTLRRLDPDTMARIFAVNTIGPALIAKHVLPLMPRDRRFVFAALSARVGSILDNRLGGWHSYRASKAALNMLIRNFALEMGRTHREGVVVGLHPGTVDSALSRPFQSNLPEGQLTEPDDAASSMISVLSRLSPADSGRVFDYSGKPVPA